MSILSQLWFALIAITTSVLAWSIIVSLWPMIRRTGIGTRVLLAAAIAASALLLLRPHEDTFTGLDTSCYRLMARSFSEGHELHDVDRTLLSLPPNQRRAVLLEYEHWGRDTRDRSFEITDLTTCATQPYFYPFLPLAASGLKATSHIIDSDYFVPLVGLIFFTVILCTGAAYGNLYGLLVAIALLIGTPLPAYLLRGYYAESVGAVLAILVLLGRALPHRTFIFSAIAPVLLGLAVCFHPMIIALSLPALAFLLFDASLSRRGVLWSVTGFAVGLLPLLLMTLWVCQPYGDIANWRVLLYSLSVNAVLRLLAIFVAGFAGVIGSIVLGPHRVKERLIQTGITLLDRPLPFLLILGAACLPFLIPSSWWPGKSLVREGFQEYRDGVRLGYAVILVSGILAAFSPRTSAPSRVLLVLSVLLSPLCFYLKGFEQMGLWSQRRLIPLSLLIIAALTPILASYCGSASGRWSRVIRGALAVGLLGAALINPIRWPAPYFTQHEKGAQAWTASVSHKLGAHFTFFDYYPYAVPFSVPGNSKIIGLSEYGYPALPGLAKWLSQLATREPILYVTAYDNPGLEDGVILRKRSRETITLPRVASRTSLPAETSQRTIDMTILDVTPIAREGKPIPLSVNKVLDDGPLALRGPWGCGSPIRTSTDVLPSRWSREGSGIIGPIPQPGQTVKISIVAAASRDDGKDGQVLKIHPPWNGPALSLPVGNDLTAVSGVLIRPDPVEADTAKTGLYTIHADTPYDPAKAGIRGYPTDLGARIHSICIQTH